jgi:hypothetical protein
VQAVQAPELRPLGVGDVLDRTFNVYRSKPVLFIGLSAIWYLVLVLVFIVLAVAVFAGALAAFAGQANSPRSPFPANPELVAGAIVGIIGFVIVGVVVAILLFSAQSASLVDAGSRRYLSKEATIGESFRVGISAAGRLFLAGLVVLLALVALWAVLFIVAGIIAAVAQGGAVGILVLVVAGLIAIVGTFYLGASWLVAPVVVVLEKVGPIAALRRAWRLSEGNRWRIIGIQVLLLILNLVLSVLLGGLFAIGGQSEQPGIGSVLQSLVNLASTIIWAPVEWIAFTVLYYDLRVRKEAFDLQLAAEALPQS